MATAVRDSTRVSAGSGTATNCDTPTGTASGDTCVVIAGINNNPTWVDNNGANALTKDLAYEPGVNQALHVWSIRPSGGNITGWGGTPDFTAGASTRWSMCMVTFSDPDGSVIWDVTPSTSHGTADITGASTTVTVSALTATTDCFLLVAVLADGNTTAIDTTPMTNDGFTVLENGGNQSIGLFSKSVAAGSTGTFSWANAVPAATQWLSIPFLIRKTSSGVTSTLAGVVSAFTGAATVVQTIPASAAASWAGFAAAATVAQTQSCSAAATWPAFACAAAIGVNGVDPVSSSVAGAWSGFTAATDAIGQALDFSVAGSWAAFQSAASVTVAPPVTTSVAGSWAGFTAAADVLQDDGSGGNASGGTRRRSRRRYRGFTPP